MRRPRQPIEPSPKLSKLGWRRGPLLALIQASLLLAPIGPPARAEVVLDRSVGDNLPAESSIPLVNGEYHIPDDFGSYNKDWESKGYINLFHSFSFFNLEDANTIPGGTTARFTAKHTPRNVIARVTGGKRSTIGGTILSEIPGANFFLLNPYGITVNGGTLDVQGSVHLTSADILRFEDGQDYDALDTSSELCLSAMAPSAFGFTEIDFPADVNPNVVVQDTNRLSVPTGKILSLVGRDRNDVGVRILSKPTLANNIDVAGAALQIASAGSAVDIPVEDLAQLEVATLDSGQLGRVSITNSALLEAGGRNTGKASGSIVIRGESFLLNNSTLSAVHDLEAAADDPGGIDIAMRGDLVIENAALVQTWTTRGGRAGDIRLRGDSVVVRGGLRGGATLNSLAQGAGVGGTVAIEAKTAVFLEEGSRLRSVTASSERGGDLVLAAGSVTIRDAGTEIFSNPQAGAGGDIRIIAAEIEVSGGAAIASQSDAGADAPGAIQLGEADAPAQRLLVAGLARVASTNDGPNAGGAIHVNATNVRVEQGGQIFASTNGAGDAGGLAIRGADRVEVVGWEDAANQSGLGAFADEDAAEGASGGLLEIHTRILEVLDAGQILTDTVGLGDAGSIKIVASERVTVQGGENGFSLVSAGSSVLGSAVVGNGGTLSIDSPLALVELFDGGQITTSTAGTGNAGELRVKADRIEIAGVDPATGQNHAGLFSRSLATFLPDPPAGPEGMEAPPRAQGGDIFVDVRGNIVLANGGEISALTRGPGDAGNIEIGAGRDISLTDSDISALSSSPFPGAGVAGRVEVRAGRRLSLRDSAITTMAEKSSGGKITIQARELVYVVDSDITTKVNLGVGEGGAINIDPDFVVLDNAKIITDAGTAGKITIVGTRFESDDSVIRASSTLTLDGEIVVEPPETEVIGQLTTLEISLVDASSLLTTPCAARTAPAGSFVVSSRSPLAASPDAPLSWLDGAGLATQGAVCPAQATP